MIGKAQEVPFVCKFFLCSESCNHPSLCSHTPYALTVPMQPVLASSFPRHSLHASSSSFRCPDQTKAWKPKTAQVEDTQATQAGLPRVAAASVVDEYVEG